MTRSHRAIVRNGRAVVIPLQRSSGGKHPANGAAPSKATETTTVPPDVANHADGRDTTTPANSALLSELIRTWPLPPPSWGRGYPPEFVYGLLREISERVHRLEGGFRSLKSELTFLQETLAQREWELDQHRYATSTPRNVAEADTSPFDPSGTVDAAMAQAIQILDAAQRAAAGEMSRAARSAKAAQLYAHVITMKALRRAQRTPQAQHMAALQTELAYRTAQLSAVTEHVTAAVAAATFGSGPDTATAR